RARRVRAVARGIGPAVSRKGAAARRRIDVGLPPHPPVAAQRVPPSPARGDGNPIPLPLREREGPGATRREDEGAGASQILFARCGLRWSPPAIARRATRMKSLWSDSEAESFVARYAAAGVNRDLALRVYTTRLLGGDPRLVLHGGGNSSVKTVARDLLGQEVEVLCVKG